MKRVLMLCAMACLAPSLVWAQKSGDWVLGKWQGGDYWFPGVVQSRSGNDLTIAYDDGTRETLPASQVREYSWGVGTRVECRWAGGTDWYAGKISDVNKDGTRIDVKYDDGDQEQLATGACRSK